MRDMEGLTDEEVAEITGLRPGTVRVRLHRARLFVRKELMKAWKPRGKSTGTRTRAEAPVSGAREPRCKAMFAELSEYLDERLDDSMCEEMEKHIDGCEPCKAFVASLEATIEEIRRAAGEAPARKVAERLRKRLMEEYGRALAGTQTART